MCCTAGFAELKQTILVGAMAQLSGRTVQIIGYQNSARNRAGGPNAMLLPFPAAKPMTERNAIDMTSLASTFDDYVEHLFPRPRSRALSFDSMGPVAAGAAVRVFDSGSYTIVLASDARDIPPALGRVPEKKRPKVSENLVNAYARFYPGWPIALCCFDGSFRAEPLLWWFEPRDPETIWLPALDGHTGEPPAEGDVAVDHCVIVGGREVHDELTHAPLKRKSYVENFLPPYIAGKKFSGSLPNGDFLIPREAAERGDLSALRRHFPHPETARAA